MTDADRLTLLAGQLWLGLLHAGTSISDATQQAALADIVAQTARHTLAALRRQNPTAGWTPEYSTSTASVSLRRIVRVPQAGSGDEP